MLAISIFLLSSICRDTPEVDIVGSNLYQRYIKRLISRRESNEPDENQNSKSVEDHDPQLPDSRNTPEGAIFNPQSVTECTGILVCTGCYNPSQENDLERSNEKNYKGHRDFPFQPELYKPGKTCDNVFDAVNYILEKEGLSLS